jgi:CDP-diacylglycerol---glycerol-3-phosphate 3-phosphatidyltransferase
MQKPKKVAVPNPSGLYYNDGKYGDFTSHRPHRLGLRRCARVAYHSFFTHSSNAGAADENMITRKIGEGGRWLLEKIVDAIAATGINPNLLTFFGLLVNCWAAYLFAVGRFRGGAMVIFFAAFLDMLDGQVARREKRVTAFGAFFDSTLDRYSDMALYMGLLVYYAVAQRTSYVVLSAVATAGSVMVSYSRARAESLIPLCKVGFMERPERMVLLMLGGLFNRMAPALWVIAIVATLTVIHRIAYTWKETKAGRTLPGVRLSL